MNSFIYRIIIFLAFTFIKLNVKSQTLIMNEVSNGPSGSQEYVEFVVVSNAVTYTCSSPTPPCIDIRGWIFDDNSGYHGTSGVAAGAVRFSQDPLWACVPLGTIILIYNDADKNPGIPATDDLSMADGNCTIIAPISNTSLFEKNTTTPGAAACSYPSTGWTAGGNWTFTALANSSDCARIVNLAGCEVFSVCYGATDNLNTLIYFPASGTGTVYSFNSVDPQLQVNWTSGSATTMQTPGVPNNAANAAYIAQFNNGCLPITQTSVTVVGVNAGCTCNGSAAANASGSIGGYTYVWYDASMNPIGQTAATATGLCAGVYNVIATSHIGCTATTSVTITSSSSTSVTVISQTVCAGTSAILTATPSAAGGTFSWTPGGQTTSSISVSPSSTTNYSVTYTLAGCSGTNNGIVTVKPLPTVTVNSPAICSGQTATLSATGATTYAWNTGSTSNPLIVSPTSSTNFTVTGTTNGCTNTAVSNISVTPLPTVTVNSSTLCSGQTATLTANGATTYVWNTGSTSNPLTVSPTSNTNFTVIGTTNGCTNTTVSNVSVTPLPTITVNSPTLCSGQTATLTANGATTYVWNTGSTSNPLTVSPTSNANFTVVGTTNGCTNAAVSNVSVTPLPTITVNSATICSGQTATITANGATTYTWNTGSTSNPLTVSPTSNTNFTIIGTTNGCTNTAVSNVTVTPLPTVTVNSSTICSGLTATLIANGASTYTWSNGSTNSTLLDNPTTTTNYTVLGEQLGCVNSATADIVINPNLSLSINTPTICAGQTTTLTSSGAITYTWSNGTNGNSIIVSPTTTTTFSVAGLNGACSGATVTTVVVNALPSVTVNSSSICAGETATLTANGAAGYTWNTGSLSNILTDAPSVNTTYTVVGTTLGCTNIAIGNVSVTPLPTVTINSSTICAGQTATLIANGAASYTWNTGSSINPLTVSPASTTTFSLVGIANGCSNLSTTTVSVTPLPTITSNSSVICAGQTATLTASGANAYLWSTGALLNTMTDSPILNTTYTVTGTTSGCTNTAIATISVTPLPTVTVNSSTICSGQTASLTANGANTYLWSTGAVGNTLTISPIGNTTYSVTGTNFGCSNTVSTTIQVVASPILSVNPTTICAGETTTLSASGASTYNWSNGSTTNSTSVNPIITTAYSVSGTIGSCSSTTTVNVIVNQLPIISVASKTICAGQAATLTASGASIYNWTSNGSINPLVISPSSTAVYTVTGTSASCSASTTATVFVQSVPTVLFNSNQNSGCAPLCVNFTDLTTVVNDTISNWYWSFGDGYGSSSQNASHCFDNPGLYDIALTVNSSNGCSKTYTDIDMINVFPNPVAEFTSNAEETDILNPIIDFTNQSSNATIYEWNFGAASTSTLTNPSYTYNQEGVYSTTLTATNQYGCNDIAIHDIIAKGIFTFYAPNTFTPNEDRKNDVFLPLGVGWDPEKYQLDIFDRWGNQCFSTEDPNIGWNGRANNGSEAAQIDTYTWKAELKDIFGKTHKYIGRVMILR